MPMKIKMGAAEFSFTVETAKGKQHYNLRKLNDNQLSGAREMIVNHWCAEHGLAAVY